MSKKKIALIIFISIIFIAVLPFALELIIFRNDIYSVLSNGEWGGFLGSYIGGALGGIGTLLAVYITTKETRKIQQENSSQIEDEKIRNEKKERKQFADTIAEDIAMYITDISKYFYACRALEQLHNKENELNNELHNVDYKIGAKHTALKKINIVNGGDTDECLFVQNELEELKQKESELKYRIERNLKEMERNKADRTIANERFFLLKIKLQNIESGADILKQLKFIHDNSANVKGTDLDFISAETDKLLNMTVRFVDRYVNQKLI
jgi:gas vesicle protein